MHRPVRFLLFLFLALSIQNAHIHAIIFESKNLSDINKHIDKDTLMVFDIDDTIAQLPKGLCQWLDFRAKELQKKGFDIAEAYDLALPMFFTIANCNPLVPLCDSPKLIKQLQDKNIKTIGLTNRSFPIIERTISQLEDIDISFANNSLCKKDMNLSIEYKSKYSHGIVFVAQNDKGQMLFLFLEKIKHTPKKIVFIDDSLKHVKAVEREAKKHGIEFIGIHFTYKQDHLSSPEVITQAMREFRIRLGLDPIEHSTIACTKTEPQAAQA